LNGDGELQFEEFLSSLRGELSPSRLTVVTQAFRKLDRKGLGVVSLNSVLQTFSPEGHIDCIKFGKSIALIVEELNNFFISRNKKYFGNRDLENFSRKKYDEIDERNYRRNNLIYKNSSESDSGEKVATREDFISYHANMSANVDDDDVFISSVRQCWGLDESKAPPPPDILNPSYFGNCSNLNPQEEVIIL